MNEQQKYQKRNLLLFPLGTVGRDAVYALINSFLLTFVLFTRSLNAAQLTAITAIPQNKLSSMQSPYSARMESIAS